VITYSSLKSESLDPTKTQVSLPEWRHRTRQAVHV